MQSTPEKTQVPPAALYKFLPHWRFLDNGLFRFTQPEELNDPEEALPQTCLGRYAPEDYERARIEAKRYGDHNPSVEDLEAVYLNPYPSRRFDEKGYPGLWPTLAPELRPEPFHSIEEYDRAVAERALQLCRQAANREIGIFSLSATTDNHMWAYYAGNHFGVAVVFDATREFFQNPARLAPVVYSNEPIFVSSCYGLVRVAGTRLPQEEILRGQVRDIPSDLYLRKRPNWQHEHEWRMVRPLREAFTVEKEADGYPICLFRVPPECITAIIIGYRAPKSTVIDIQRRVKTNAIWHHLSLRHRVKRPDGRIEERII